MAARYFMMPEEEWRDLCAKQCVERRKQWGEDDCDGTDGVICSECATDAAERVPVKYHCTKEEMKDANCDTLPGFRLQEIAYDD